MLNRVLVLCGIIMMVFLGTLAYVDGGKETAAHIRDEITYIETHQAIRPKQ